jgi:2-polyprenyl-3-methyl-5-hydroxy-6-metoxy-1,4-benzoquinol methylase
MDRCVKRWEAEKDGDLMICEPHGCAYQRDMSKGRIAYDAKYLANYDAYAVGPIAEALNTGRCAMLARHAGAGAAVLDVGAASGLFVRCARSQGFAAAGFDVIPEAVARLREAGLYGDDPEKFDVLTMWDSIEHMDEPELWLRNVHKGALLLAAIPVFEDLRRVRESRHFKPGEHYYYFTPQGFIDWMALYGYRLLEQSTHEVDAGRDSIGAFAFCRDLPDYRDHIEAYAQLHEMRHYGDSATELHLETVRKIVSARNPRSILDYGCGRSDLAVHFWRDGYRRISRYDPALRKFREMPEGQFDLVLCMDVLEHIPMASVDKVLTEVREKSAAAVFTISTKLARAKLPDGRNAHCTLLTRPEWTRWVAEYFGQVVELPSHSDQELVLMAGSARKGLRQAA